MKAVLDHVKVKALYLWPADADIPGGKSVEVSEDVYNRIFTATRDFNEAQAALRLELGQSGQCDE